MNNRKRKLLAALFLLLADDDSSDSDSSSELELDSDSDMFDEDILLKSDSDSSLDLSPASKTRRKENYVDETVEEYTDEEFKKVFRVIRDTYEHLLFMIQEDSVLPNRKAGRQRIPDKNALLMVLYYLSKPISFREISIKFNVTLSSSHRLITHIITYLSELVDKHIKWPIDEEKKYTTDKFKQETNIEGVIGAINNFTVNIKKHKDSEEYLLEESKYGIKFQIVSDAENIITDFFCVDPKIHNIKEVLLQSSLNTRAANGEFSDCYLIGDSDYPSLDWLIVPMSNDNLSEDEIQFNANISKGNSISTKTVSMLKERFQHLEFFDNDNIDFIMKCVKSTIVLHNICVIVDGPFGFEGIFNGTSEEDT